MKFINHVSYWRNAPVPSNEGFIDRLKDMFSKKDKKKPLSQLEIIVNRMDRLTKSTPQSFPVTVTLPSSKSVVFSIGQKVKQNYVPLKEMERVAFAAQEMEPEVVRAMEPVAKWARTTWDEISKASSEEELLSIWEEATKSEPQKTWMHIRDINGPIPGLAKPSMKKGPDGFPTWGSYYIYRKHLDSRIPELSVEIRNEEEYKKYLDFVSLMLKVYVPLSAKRDHLLDTVGRQLPYTAEGGSDVFNGLEDTHPKVWMEIHDRLHQDDITDKGMDQFGLLVDLILDYADEVSTMLVKCHAEEISVESLSLMCFDVSIEEFPDDFGARMEQAKAERLAKFREVNGGPKVFLGGTCGDSKWRDQVIPLLEIGYFNPVVENWDDEAAREEYNERNTCDLILYTITPLQEGFLTLVEVTEDAIRRPDLTVVLILNEDSGEVWDEHGLASLDEIERKWMHYGVPIFRDVEKCVEYLNRQGSSNVSQEFLGFGKKVDVDDIMKDSSTSVHDVKLDKGDTKWLSIGGEFIDTKLEAQLTKELTEYSSWLKVVSEDADKVKRWVSKVAAKINAVSDKETATNILKAAISQGAVEPAKSLQGTKVDLLGRDKGTLLYGKTGVYSGLRYAKSVSSGSVIQISSFGDLVKLDALRKKLIAMGQEAKRVSDKVHFGDNMLVNNIPDELSESSDVGSYFYGAYYDGYLSQLAFEISLRCESLSEVLGTIIVKSVK